jgi:ParB/RepB/Spo0J family partition protein
MDYDCRSVPLDRIDAADLRFRITTTIDKDDLSASIQGMGLLHPPILADQGSIYKIVSGYRRIDACRRLKRDPIQARILPSDTPPSQCARIAIADNTCQRSLNVVEQSRAYILIRQSTTNPQAMCAMAQSVGLPDSQAAISRIMTVAAMPALLQEAILSGDIALPVALQISRLEPDEANAMIGFFKTITAGLNVQRELLDLIRDISRRDRTSMARLLEKKPVAPILQNKDRCSPSQQVHQLRRLLKRMRYPTLCQVESDFRQAVKSLSLDPRIKIEPPLFFEGRSYRIRVTVDTRQQLKRLQAELAKLADHPHILPE